MLYSVFNVKDTKNTLLQLFILEDAVYLLVSSCAAQVGFVIMQGKIAAHALAKLATSRENRYGLFMLQIGFGLICYLLWIVGRGFSSGSVGELI